MHRPRTLFIVLPLLLSADAAVATSKHEETRRSAGNNREKASSSDDRHHDDDDSDSWGPCLSGCFSEGCSVVGQALVDGRDAAVDTDDGPPAPPPPLGWNGRFDLRTTGAWIFADLPNASFDVFASVGPRGPGPAFQVWYTGLWERIDGTWDHLPVAGARLAFAFGTESVRPELRLGGALLVLRGAEAYAFDGGLGLEIRAGDESAPRIDLHADALFFDGLTGTDLGVGVSFPGGPFYVRVGLRSLYLETFYVGPEIGLGVRL